MLILGKTNKYKVFDKPDQRNKHKFHSFWQTHNLMHSSLQYHIEQIHHHKNLLCSTYSFLYPLNYWHHWLSLLYHIECFYYPKDLLHAIYSYLPTSVQFNHPVVSDSFPPHGLQHVRPPCPSPTPKVYSNSCPLSWWCHPAISSSVIPFSSCPQSLPASGFFPMSQLFAWGGQSIGVSASASVLPMNTQDWSSLGWTGWISLQSKGLSRVFSNTIFQKHQFFCSQLSLKSNSHIHTWPLEKP